uniref:Uncharacterized protein n=1 Tax=Aureoumbra lagunensis TaxID=44058 RepID=A0A7S3K0V6_9STRA|mmetsp:Transcript_12924/g.17312  ORF Transcript_12924/g.17312 Transcript_12924/m.17312 type:complete len:193 (-) Transcript_12924:373-951(-)|eukprot:CAMPEP_0197327048 /NCGR_PEP_ID=MMETSP0892-20130614/2354_1 /TAXON_ID=44058 ORGANISM="Aureoumbra lagunensis, Strain CCMP1510" /NCGR_SAMPLE_ID=MMETSP0892 /ASSEMBLY_ACC=CAM_ASM_000538 /LENGTH=192 /DNA_ID=CAMNT_0042821549 /DNA_START=34 /DNA_END=612 /DNA_ORIENTATION=+
MVQIVEEGKFETNGREDVKVLILKAYTKLSKNEKSRHGIVIHQEDDDTPIKFDESEMVGDVARIIADECGIDNDVKVAIKIDTDSLPCKAGDLIGEAISVGDYIVAAIEPGTTFFKEEEEESNQNKGGAFDKLPQHEYAISAKEDLMQPAYKYDGVIPCYKADYFRPQPGRQLSSPCCSETFSWFGYSSSTR